MRAVSIVGIGQIPVLKQNPNSVRQIGAQATKLAMADAGVDHVDALFAGNMLADELQSQKHIASLIADEAGLYGIEALQVRAATATGAAALRMAYLAVASGEADLAIAVGAEKMSEGQATPALAKALDADKEVVAGSNMISQNARLMQMYIDQYKVPEDGFANFAVNAHKNGATNPNARFQKAVSAESVLNSRLVYPPFASWTAHPSAMALPPSCLRLPQKRVPIRACQSRFWRLVFQLTAFELQTDRTRWSYRPQKHQLIKRSEPPTLIAATYRYTKCMMRSVSWRAFSLKPSALPSQVKDGASPTTTASPLTATSLSPRLAASKPEVILSEQPPSTRRVKLCYN